MGLAKRVWWQPVTTRKSMLRLMVLTILSLRRGRKSDCRPGRFGGRYVESRLVRGVPAKAR